MAVIKAKVISRNRNGAELVYVEKSGRSVTRHAVGKGTKFTYDHQEFRDDGVVMRTVHEEFEVEAESKTTVVE